MNSQRCQRKKRITNTLEKSSQAVPPSSSSIETCHHQPSPQPPQQVPLRTNSQMLVDCDDFIDLMTVKRPPSKISGVIEKNYYCTSAASYLVATKQRKFATCQSPPAPQYERRNNRGGRGRHQSSISSFKAFHEDFIMDNNNNNNISHLQQVKKVNLDPRHVESDAVQ